MNAYELPRLESSLLLIRADANVKIGTGHVMRCMALAQAWQDKGGRVLWVFAEMTASFEERLQRENVKSVKIEGSPGSKEDSEQTVTLASKSQASWVVLDGYHFGVEFQTAIKNAHLKLLFVDDNGHAGEYSADFVLNQNVYARASMYKNREPHTQLLLGTRFALLRREFAGSRDWQRTISRSGARVLISLGGSDPENVTSKVLNATLQARQRSLQVRVIVGGINPHHNEIRDVASNAPFPIQVISDTYDMPSCMMWADVMISSAGSICWESCFFGLPAIVIDIAKNQRSVAERLHELGVAIHLCSAAELKREKIASTLDSLLNSPATRVQMSEAGHKLVDGKGAARVESFMSSPLRLRRARQSDALLLWDWANDPEVRANSFSTETITWAVHEEWFRTKLEDNSSKLYIATNPVGEPVGQARFDIDQKRAKLSVAVGKQFRGQGNSRTIIFQAMETLFQEAEVEFVDAYVKAKNRASLRLFAAAGFTDLGCKQVHGNSAVHFVFEKCVSRSHRPIGADT